MELKTLSESEYRKLLPQVYEANKKFLYSFSGFDNLNKKLFLGKTPLLEKMTKTHYCGTASGKVLTLCTLFESPNSSSLGQFLVTENLSTQYLEAFFKSLKEALSTEVLFPLNGHFNLGFSAPEEIHKPSSFLTSGGHSVLDPFFKSSALFERSREMQAYTLKANEALSDKIESKLKLASPDFTVRNISRLHFRRDIKIYNALVNKCMVGHYGFTPLSFEEEWDLVKFLLFIIEPEYFKFLMHKDIEIGFCFGIPDYNQILKNDSDYKNILRLLVQKQKITKARIIYSGILPEYRGRGLFKFVRHQVIRSMIQKGIKEIESSYIDQDNKASQLNAQSTGASLSRRFFLYQFKR